MFGSLHVLNKNIDKQKLLNLESEDMVCLSYKQLKKKKKIFSHSAT
jgi:hypothetical protein